MLYSAQHNVLVYPSDAPLVIAQCCDDARQLTDGRVVVPAHLANLQRLTSKGVPVIEPMDASGYTWPSKYPRPFHAQRVTANFLVLNRRAFVLSDMGTGKTLAALWAADWLMRQHHAAGQPFRALIVSPLSTLRTVWEKECFEAFMSSRKVQILHGPAAKRQERLSKEADFYIINHDGLAVGATHKHGRQFDLAGFAADLANRKDIRLAILDEASAYRDGRSRRSLITQLLLGRREYLWAMTATPTPNGPPDAFGIAKLVNNAFGESFTSFQNRVMLKLGPLGVEVPRAGAQVEVKKLLSPAVRFAIEDCVDLPPTTTTTREVPLSPEQDKAMKDLKKNLMLQLAQGRIDVANEAVLRMKLIQIACGAVYDTEHVAHEIDCGPRISELLAVIEESARKVIIFAPLTSVVKMLNTKLTKLTKHRVAMIHGGVGPNDRAKIFQDFQDGGAGSAHLLVADAGTMSHGLTLTAATTICWYGPSERTEVYLQANKRIPRPGQQLPTAIVHLASTPTEREIYKRLANNESMQGVMLKLTEQ